MIQIFRRFFAFSGKENRHKFIRSIFLGVLKAIFEAMKIPAIAVTLHGVLSGDLTVQHILLSFGIMLLSVAGNAFANYRSTMLQCEAGYGTCADKRIEIAEHLKYLPMGYFNRNSLGYITSVATNSMEALADVATRVVMMVTQGILTTIFVVLMILLFDLRIGGIAVLGVLLYFAINSLLQKKSKTIAPLKDSSDRKLVEKVLEYVQGIAEVKAYNLTGKKSRALNEAIDENSVANTKAEMAFVPIMFLQNLTAKLLGVVVAIISVAFYLNGTMELLNAVVMILAAFILFGVLDTAGNYSALLRNVDLYVGKAQAVLDMPTMDIDGKDIIPSSYDIDVENAEFSYDKRKIIDGVSIHIPQHTTTAIVGPSGGGKTTLCHLISRFWDVDKGCVKLGGVDVREYSMDSLMRNFSFVFQSVYLFQDTIANNIRFGQPDAPMEKVIEAARKACCHDFIMALPDGYDTVIGEGGASLSGGERQRISIARAIMKDAPIIILDEATANVDPESEQELTAAIEALTKEKTILMIAHRLKTVRHADNILVIDKGRIAQSGTHEQLMEQGGIYRRFVESREQAVGWKV
ncbi:ABC transporter ATP-binding protein [Hominiventricola filiformis]|uniref:ABC transporter ATP-binding protein/permease n=1 Tax=Hominiventricola filiformis TaxID=2885352 RepID=A0AAE3DB51_9FIRM|nr:ABC transporter ATP-binding protein [Hominiventricola filiformis]MCC2127653.1 ABC transporter ATP-binding protein/permease [Hominiventricola filiformis]